MGVMVFLNKTVNMEPDELKRRVDDAIAAFDREAKLWRTVPDLCRMSRERLLKLLVLNAPNYIVLNEITILRRKIVYMQSTRLGVLVN